MTVFVAWHRLTPKLRLEPFLGAVNEETKWTANRFKNVQWVVKSTKMNTILIQCSANYAAQSCHITLLLVQCAITLHKTYTFWLKRKMSFTTVRHAVLAELKEPHSQNGSQDLLVVYLHLLQDQSTHAHTGIWVLKYLLSSTKAVNMTKMPILILVPTVMLVWMAVFHLIGSHLAEHQLSCCYLMESCDVLYHPGKVKSISLCATSLVLIMGLGL